jgi:hypothetical protein
MHTQAQSSVMITLSECKPLLLADSCAQKPAVHQRFDKLQKQLPLDAIAEEEEEEIKANVKADQSSVADSTASGNKVILMSC